MCLYIKDVPFNKLEGLCVPVKKLLDYHRRKNMYTTWYQSAVVPNDGVLVPYHQRLNSVYKGDAIYGDLIHSYLAEGPNGDWRRGSSYKDAYAVCVVGLGSIHDDDAVSRAVYIPVCDKRPAYLKDITKYHLDMYAKHKKKEVLIGAHPAIDAIIKQYYK